MNYFLIQFSTSFHKKITILIISIFFAAFSTSAIDWENPGPGGGAYLMGIAFQPDNEDIMYLGSDVAGVHKSTNGGMAWVKVNNGLNASNLEADTYGVENILIDPFDYDTLYLAGWSGVFKSTNGAAKWFKILDKNIPFGALAIDPTNRNIVYAGVGEMDVDINGKGELYRSLDGGQTWNLISRNFHKKAVIYGIIIDPNSPTNSRKLLVGTGKGMYKSTNGGATWEKANKGLRSKKIRMMDSIFKNGTVTIYALSAGGKVSKSTDFGESWRRADKKLPHAPFTELVIHPTDPNTVFVALWQWQGTTLGVYKTSDSGQSWQLLTRDEENVKYAWINDWWSEEGGSYLGVAPSNPDIIVYGETTMFKTTNGGVNWAFVYTTDMGGGKYRGHGLEPTYVYDVAFDPTDSNRYYIAYEDIGLWITDNGGASYSQVNQNKLTVDNNGVSSVAVDPDTPATIYATCAYIGLAPDAKYASKRGFILKSKNYGQTWERLKGLAQKPARIIIDASSPVAARVIYALTYGKGIYRSPDGGDSWEKKKSGFGKMKKHIWSFALDTANPSVLYAGANTFEKKEGGLFKTTNSGESWQKLASFPANDVFSIVVDTNNPGTVYVGAVKSDWKTGGLYKTTDGGNTWSLPLAKPYVFAAVIDPSNSNALYAAASQQWESPTNPDHGLYRSMDGGGNWEKLDTPPVMYVEFLSINPHEPDYLYVGSHGGGLFKGKVW